MRDLAALPDAHLRIFDRPAPPQAKDLKDVYLIGVCGKGMGALAELFVQAGYTVVGSDEAAYPPMSTRLDELGVPVIEGYAEENLASRNPNLVIVGNAATPTHPEAAYAREHEMAQLSFPEAVSEYFIEDRTSLVVAGTHGKTTTTGMLLHVFTEAGLDPGYLVGGVMTGYGSPCSVGTGNHFIVEGDEYDSAYFDKRPKMLLYKPTSAIITSMEFDHADIYEDWNDYRAAFRRFVGLIPEEGLLALNGDDPEVRALADYARCRVRFFGLEGDDDHVAATKIKVVDGGQRFTLVSHGEELVEIFLPMSGWHNRFDALGVCAIALDEGLTPKQIQEGFASFKGLKRRQEVLGEPGGVVVVDDFAHHPTAVHATVRSLKERWPDRRLVAIFEPRSNSSRRKVFEERYGEAFVEADEVFISVPPLRHNDVASDFLDAEAVATRVREGGVPAQTQPNADALLAPLMDTLQPGDVALIMSNGSFDGLHQKLVGALEERAAQTA